jgi:hypothetical protein
MNALPKDIRTTIERGNKEAEVIVAARKEAQDKHIASLAPVPDPEEKPAQNAQAEPTKENEQPSQEQVNTENKPPQEGEEWRKKYEVLQGKYNAEVPRLSKQVRGLNEELDRVRTILASRQESPAAPAIQNTVANSATANFKTLLTPQEVEDYGEDLIAVVKKAAKEELLPEIEMLKNENKHLKEVVGTVNEKVTVSDRQRVFVKLSEQVKDWQKINEDEAFLSWLNQVDPYSGQRRQVLLNNAFNSNDADRVTAFFTGYLQEHAAVEPTLTEAPAERQATLPLDSLAAPGRNRTVPSESAQSSQRIWTQKEIGAFYHDVNRGAFKGRDKERQQVERSIFAAVNKGLVR